jgi:hypothetical protein
MTNVNGYLMYEIKQPRKMVNIDRAVLILYAMIMYAHGVSNLVIGTILVSTLILEYMFYQEQCRFDASYAYQPGEVRNTHELQMS